jgi:hypothetical protein
LARERAVRPQQDVTRVQILEEAATKLIEQEVRRSKAASA